MSPCILTPYALGSHGYGQICINNERLLHHRVAYCEAKGVSLASIKGMVVRHTCDNKPCINPEHLVIGTQSDNMMDCVERDRHARVGLSGEEHPGAKLTAEQVDSIRSEFTGRRGQLTELGTKYGVHRSLVRKIVDGKLWSKH